VLFRSPWIRSSLTTRCCSAVNCTRNRSMVRLLAFQHNLDEHPCCQSHRNIKILGGRIDVLVHWTHCSMSQSVPREVYLQTHKGRMRYDLYRCAGLPLTSCHVE